MVANHLYDDRLELSQEGHDTVCRFYRESRRGPFTYYGRLSLVSSKINRSGPSHFRIRTVESIGDSPAETGPGVEWSDDAFEALPEGKKRLAMHVSYERNSKNREAALERHGRACIVCKLPSYGAQTTRRDCSDSGTEATVPVKSNMSRGTGDTETPRRSRD